MIARKSEIGNWPQFWYTVGMSWGMPSLLLLLIFFGIGASFWCLGPQVTDSLKKFVDSTVAMQERVTLTQSEISKTQTAIAESQKALIELVSEIKRIADNISSSTEKTIEFTSEVRQDHKSMLLDLEELKKDKES